MTDSLCSFVDILADALSKSVKKQSTEKKKTHDMRVTAAELAKPLLTNSQNVIEMIEDLKYEYDRRMTISFDQLHRVVEWSWTSQCELFEKLAASGDTGK